LSNFRNSFCRILTDRAISKKSVILKNKNYLKKFSEILKNENNFAKPTQ
jgi:hypothetical protein